MPDLAPVAVFIQTRFAPRGTTRIDAATSLVESGWLDSFAIVDLVAFLEHEYGVTLGDREIVPANFETLAAIGQLVERARRQGRPGGRP